MKEQKRNLIAQSVSTVLGLPTDVDKTRITINPSRANFYALRAPCAGPLSAYIFSTFCFLSSLPFLGIPFPTHSASAYYARKNAWLSNLSPILLTPHQAGYVSAVLRITLGLGLVSRRYRMLTLGVMAGIVGTGTVLAYRDGRPMGPQWGMLGVTGIIWLLNRR